MGVLPGFDDRWQDVPHFINGITHDIWESRGIDTLTRYYGPDLIVRSPASVVRGNAGIIAATQSTLAEFPDRQLLGEDVIWTQTDARSFLSSHRLLCAATHSGAGIYGAATGAKLTYRILADCWCHTNAVHDEWLVRDQGAIVLQMGATLPDWTRALIAREGGPRACVQPLTPETNIAGPYTDTGSDDPWAQTHADLLRRLMDGAQSTIPEAYDPACELHYPCHVHSHGHPAADAFWLGLRSALPGAQFTVHHQAARSDPALPPRTALRWSLTGAHDGPGRFGPASGACLHVMGITHAEFGPRGLRREWTLIDDTAV